MPRNNSYITRWLKTSRLRADHSGVSAVEFAMLAPVFLLIICGTLEFSLITYVSSVMEGATTMTARMGKTGYSATGLTRQQQIINTINAKTAGLLNPNLITMTTTVYTNFADVGQPEPCIKPVSPPCPGTPGINFVDVNGNGTWDSDMGAAGVGSQGDVVVYTVTYPWTVVTPIINRITGSPYNITARTVVRNEPFGSGVGG